MELRRQLWIILDELMNGLDKRGVADVRQLLLDLKKEGKQLFWQAITRQILMSYVMLCMRWIAEN